MPTPRNIFARCEVPKNFRPKTPRGKKHHLGEYVSPCFNLIQNAELQYERLLLKYPRARPLFGVLLESQEIRQAG
jgi:hypothetical protein